MQNFAIVIPTYNERGNIRKLVLTLLEMYPAARIFVVDDNSPDGTAEVVNELARNDGRVKLVFRDSRQGLSTAYMDAFARILPDDTIHHIVTMDADLSHNPADLPGLLEHAASHDLVVGSRYVEGGTIDNWEWWRKFVSTFGNAYTRLVLGVPIYDLTGGFVVYTREALAGVLPHIEVREPYAYQTEMKYLAYRLGSKIKEVPIKFTERGSGKSKFKQRAVLEALFFPWYLRLLGRRLEKNF
ncbi:MAG: Glycosyl transferase, group 2 family protein [Parcubacteria group bacterium GW2011_GWA2_51_12]|nr:MAG: Glycosyl transferase, group 2 family protein [Parcubacteria group bacterium GW2011_GWA2_51_12]